MENNRKTQRIIIVLISVLTLSLPMAGQQSNSTKKLGKVTKDSVYCMDVDKYPEFPGGRFAMSIFMYKNLKYPQKAIINKHEGLLRVEYVVRKDGSISDPVIVTKETSQELNNEVLRVMRLMPNFKPAVNKGEKVSYKMWGENINFQLKPCKKKEFYPIIITPNDCRLPTFSADAKGVYTFVEKFPEYKGGVDELKNIIYKNLWTNERRGLNEIVGTVILLFVVTKNGQIKDIEVIRTLEPTCDKEAIRVAKLLTDWIPGEHNGKKVDVYYTLPVRFKIE